VICRHCGKDQKLTEQERDLIVQMWLKRSTYAEIQAALGGHGISESTIARVTAIARAALSHGNTPGQGELFSP
jgi:uncharacterized protein YerC